MRRTPYLLIVAMTLMLSATTCSCSEDPEEEKQEQKEDKLVEDWENVDMSGDATMSSVPVKFSVAMGSVLPDPQVSTRGACDAAGENYAFAVNDIVTISITGQGVKNYKVTNVDGTLVYAGTDNKPFVWDTPSLEISAWSYGNTTDSSTDPASFTLSETQSSNYGELLYAPAITFSYSTYKDEETKVPIKLYHQLARVRFNLSSETGNALDISSIYIGDGSSAVIPTTATFSEPESGNFGTWPTATIGTQKGHIIPKTETSNSVYSAVLIPADYAANTKFLNIKTSDNRTYAYTLSALTSLQAGKQYFFSIKVKDAILPIDFVAAHNMKTTTTMASDDDPANSAYFYWGSNGSSTDYMTDNMKNFMNGITIGGTKYHLPSIKEWMSIIAPLYATSGYLEGVEGAQGVRITYAKEVFTQTGLGEPLEWGRKSDGTYLVSGKFYNEYATSSSYTSTTDGITRKYGYAIRLKATDVAGPSGYGKYTCAYRYTYTSKDESCNDAPSLRVRVKYLGASSTVTLSDIVGLSNASYWEDDYKEIIIPHCGDFSDSSDHSAGSYSSATEKTDGFYWSSTPINTSNAHYFRTLPSEIRGDNWRGVSCSFNIRLFKDY